jgi:hypothetical protein
MNFDPKSESEIRSSMVLPPGVYDFEVAEATEKVSKAGNDMIELQLRVFPGDGGSPRLLRDWLVSTMELKLNRFCYATGLEDAYNEGSLTAFACLGASGQCRVTVEGDEKYGDQNRIKDYVVERNGEALSEPAEVVKSMKRGNDLLAQEWEQIVADKSKIDESDVPF